MRYVSTTCTIMQQSIMLGVKACLKAARKGTHCTGKACKTPGMYLA